MSQENPDDLECGAFPSLSTIRLMAEWAPIVARLQSVLAAPTASEKAKALVKFAVSLAEKTKTSLDDEAAKHLEAVLNTPEGAALVDWAASLLEGKS